MFKAHFHSKREEKAKQSGYGKQLGNLGENRSKLPARRTGQEARRTHQAWRTGPQTPVLSYTGTTHRLGAMHRESGAVHRGKITSFTKFFSVFRPDFPSLTFSIS